MITDEEFENYSLPELRALCAQLGVNDRGDRTAIIYRVKEKMAAPPARPLDADETAKLYEIYEAMPLEELWKAAQKVGLKVGEGVTKKDLVEQLVVKEEEKARNEATAKKRAAAVKKKADDKPPPNPDFQKGSGLDLDIKDAALILGAMLPQDAHLNLALGSCETYSRHAARSGENEVVYSKTDSQGNNRRYRITLPVTLTFEEVEEI